MKNPSTWWVVACAFCVAACAAGNGSAPAKHDFASLSGGKDDSGRDYCAEYAWYGDGECDTFCTDPDPDCATGIRNLDGEGPTLCVGARGNGQLIAGHFASLARIVEHYGLIDGYSGGSSASITGFLLESIEMNPQVRCVGCDSDEQAARAALLLKSTLGYFGELTASEEALAAGTLATLAGRISERGIGSLLEDNPLAGAAALLSLLGSSDFRAVINPEVLWLLATSPDRGFHARDILSSIGGISGFDPEDTAIFVRPGLLNFPALARRTGRIGSFYAGYAPADDLAMGRFLEDCATPSRGLTWAEAASLPSGDSTCGAVFSSMVRAFRDHVRADESRYPSRIDDSVGDEIHALISTSVLEGDATVVMERGRDDYAALRPLDLSVDFEDVRFGYWGARPDLHLVMQNSAGYADEKTRRFTSLGTATWREILSYSPAEPGLARALELPDGRLSAGGWSDLHPTLVLRNMGCEQVIYVNRRGRESGFSMGVATMLGMDEQTRSAIFDTADTRSAFGLSIAEADGVWCTNWGGQPETDQLAIESDAYNAPFEVRDARLLGEGAYTNTSDDLGLVGCSIGR